MNEFQLSNIFSSKFTYTVTLRQYGENIDITKLIREIKDITYQLNNYASVDMILHDKEKRIFNLIHLNGPYQIIIRVEDLSGNEIVFTGVIRKFVPIDVENDLYGLSLWSFYESQNLTVIRKGFIGSKTISSIIIEMMKDKNIFVDDTSKPIQHFIEETESNDHIENFIIPSWNFFTTVQYLKQFARSRSNSIFYFFESPSGLNFVSKQMMLQNAKSKGYPVFKFSTLQTYSVDDQQFDTNEEHQKNVVPLNPIYEYNLVTGINFNEHIKQLDFGFKSYILDYNTKNISINIRDFKSIFNKTLTINSKSMLDVDSIDKIQGFNIIEYRDNPSLFEAFSNYHMQKNMMSDLKLKFVTNGMLFLGVGDVVRIDVPGIVGTVDFLSGLWMIEKISHRVEVSSGANKQQRLTTTITVSRDSVDLDDTTSSSINLLKKNHLALKS